MPNTRKQRPSSLNPLPFFQAETGETSLTLEAWVPGFLAGFHSAKERLERLVHIRRRDLQNVAVDLRRKGLVRR